jgi:ribose transport system ATP-binding protein
MRELGYDVDVEVAVGELTASERTGIAIARALHRAERARVLVVDEPTAMLPRHEVETLFEALERVRRSGLGIIYVSHRLDEIFALADRVTILRDGRRVGTFATGELDGGRLVSLMAGGEPLVALSDPGVGAGGPRLLRASGLSGAVLDGVSFAAHAGEVLGFAGLTGSGREELLPLLFGARDRGGVVELDGAPVPGTEPAAAIAAGIALVPSDRHRDGSVTSLTVRENLVLADLHRHTTRFGVVRRERERTESRDWAESLDIRPPDPDASFTSLSGGNQQKVVLAKWLRLRPRVLLLDEPTQGVDVHAKAMIHRLVREIADRGTAVIVASTDDEELCECCDRVLVLRDGQIAGELGRDEITPHNLARLQLAAAA